jgi:hypothetical protein
MDGQAMQMPKKARKAIIDVNNALYERIRRQSIAAIKERGHP